MRRWRDRASIAPQNEHRAPRLGCQRSRSANQRASCASAHLLVRRRIVFRVWRGNLHGRVLLCGEPNRARLRLAAELRGQGDLRVCDGHAKGRGGVRVRRKGGWRLPELRRREALTNNLRQEC
jgi:hypothetical protein